MPEIQNEIFQLLVTAILMANVCYCANEDESWDKALEQSCTSRCMYTCYATL